VSGDDRTPRALRALGLLTVDLLRRLLREPIVLRSLVFPTVLCAVTIAATVLVTAVLWPPGRLAITAEAALPALVAEVEAGGWAVDVVDDPEPLVHAGDALVGTDGATIWTFRAGTESVRLDALVRKHLGAGWRMDVAGSDRTRKRGARSAHSMMRVIGALFAFYGVVFGAGSVARDRDEGTFDAELALAVPMWVHPAARWLAGSTVLSLFFAFSVLLFEALLGSDSSGSLIVHGVASCFASTAIGLMVIGRAGLENGFVGPLSAGLVAAVSLIGFGAATSGPDRFLPIASLFAPNDSGFISLAVAGLFGAAAVAVFTARSTAE
jgi:hypothetical protein